MKNGKNWRAFFDTKADRKDRLVFGFAAILCLVKLIMQVSN